MHYQRQKRNRPMDIAARLYDLHNAVTPSGAHYRATAAFGPVKDVPCMECSGPSYDWAYDGTDPSQLYDSNGKGKNKVFYSRYPEFYMPMCRRCHLTRDRRLLAKELEEYRTLKSDSGLDYEELRSAVGL